MNLPSPLSRPLARGAETEERGEGGARQCGHNFSIRRGKGGKCKEEGLRKREMGRWGERGAREGKEKQIEEGEGERERVRE